MKEINFYCIEEEINSFLYSFLSKLVEKDKKVIIYSEDEEKMKKLDDTLWNIKKTGFLPHLLISDLNAEKTPILISNEKQNINNSNYLLISSFFSDDGYLNQFEKIFYIFSPINSNSILEVEKSWNEYKQKNFDLKLLRKNKEGKWNENLNFEIS